MKKNIKFIYMILFVLFVSCLPQEKTTQCGSNEAFDATKRKCVATLGAGKSTVSIANITPSSSYAISKSDPSKTHAVTVSDPYSAGYQIRWNLTQPNGTVLLLGTGTSITFNHISFAAGTYILEIQLLSSTGSEVYDSRSWTVSVTTDTTPTVTGITATPFTTTTTGSAVNISSTANNPDAIASVNYQWYVNGSAIAGQSGVFSSTSQALSFSFDPTSSASYYAGAGVYSVQLVLSENITNLNYSTYTWTITNNLPNFTSSSIASSGLYGTTTPNAAALVHSLNGTAIGSSGFLYDTNADGTLDAIDFCMSVSDVTGVNGDGVFIDFLKDGVLIPGISQAIPNNQFTTNGTALCLGDIVSTFDIDLVDATVVESHTITAVVYDGYTGNSNRAKYNGMTEIDRKVWQIRARPLNTAPSIEIDYNATGAGGNISCSTQSASTFSNCTITHSTSFDVAIEVEDDDYDPTDFTTDYQYFKVQFYLNGELLDGSTSANSNSDCFEDFTESNSASRYICSVTINPYNLTGPVSVTGKTYTLTAKVTDQQSPYAVVEKDSNTVTWNINSVLNYNSGIAVNGFAANDAAKIADTTLSWVSTQVTPGTALTLDDNVTPTVTENDIIQFHVQIDDPERDSHTIKIERCYDVACASTVVPVLQTVTVNSTNNTNPRVTAINHQVSQKAVTGAASADVYYKVSVTDTDGATAEQIITIFTNNYNPDPVFNSANFNPTIATSLIAFSGFPLSIDPGAITDASTADGNTIKYQWAFSQDAGTTWNAIDGATSKVLSWSPGTELNYTEADATQGLAIKLKLCIGDDGVDATGTAKNASSATTGVVTCSYNTLDSTYDGAGGISAALSWNVTVYSNMMQGQLYNVNPASYTSNGLLSTWIDPTSVDPVVTYTAYVSINNEIIIDKIVTSSDGTKAGSGDRGAVTITNELASIKFPASTDGSYTSNEVTNLSLTGDSVNGALYLAYMTPISGVDEVHIRRIDISSGKTGFVHSGKFGWDPGYNDLTDNIIITGGGMDPEAINVSTGETEITITNSANNVAMSINFNGLLGGSADLIGGTDFCNPTSTCTTATDTATNLAAAINASTEQELQGITASSSGNIVTLHGIVEDDFLEGSVGANKIGSIMVNQTTQKWVLPYIDNEKSGANKYKISVLEGDLNTRIVDSNPTKTLLSGTLPSLDLANDIDDNDTMILAVKSNSTGNIAVYEYNSSNALQEANTNIFSDTGVTNLRVAVSHETTDFEPSAFITGLNANNRISYARTDSSSGDFNLAGATVYLDLDSGFSLISEIDNYAITAGPTEYQLLMAVVVDADADTFYDAYLLNITGATPLIDCSYDSADAQNEAKCMKLLTAGTDTVFNLQIGLGDVLKDVTIGTAGSVSGENTNDIIPLAFHVDDGGGSISLDAKVINGILNVSNTTLSATGTNSGKNHMIPYVSAP